MSYTDSGKLVVNITSAGGALPSANATVRIYGVDESNGGIEYSFLTDVDGISRTIVLPAPNRSLSLSPGASESSYALYNIVASLDGYYTVRISNVAVFDGETTVQPINLIPTPIHNNNVTFPHGNLNVSVRENEMLE